MTLPIDSSRVRLHLDASDATTISVDGDGRVTQWRDKSINAHHFSSSAGATAPLRLNQSVRFDPPSAVGVATRGSDVRMLECNQQIINAYPSDIFAVLSNVNNTETIQGPVITHRSSITSYEFLFYRGAIRRISSDSNLVFQDIYWEGGAAHLIHSTFDQASHHFDFDERASVSKNVTESSPFYGPVYIGVERFPSINYPSYRLSADIHEIVIVANATESDRIAMRNYFVSQWPSLLVRISSRVRDLQSAGSPRVVVFNLAAPADYTDPLVNSAGEWTSIWPSNIARCIYYLSRDDRCPPITHGPYTAE
jgi:hypothetical protein